MKIGLPYYCGGHFGWHPILVEILARFDTFKGCARTPDFGQAHTHPPPQNPSLFSHWMDGMDGL